MKHLAAALLLAALWATPANARTLCTLVAEADTGRILLEQGDCQSRVTPASTFKIPIALMGFDSGVLLSADEPELPFRKGYADWGGKNWTRPTNPRDWMRYSVVWYSQQITKALGPDRFARYTAAFGYGNADVSGDPGRNNGLSRAWLSSSLAISPLEQVGFLRRLANRDLPVAPAAIERTLSIIETTVLDGGWSVSGKTGAAYPRMADGRLDREHGWGWFVGWAERDGQRLVFARLDQDEKRMKGSAGIRARDDFLDSWPRLADSIR